MISAPSEMRCSEMPVVRITRKVMASTSGMAMATTSPARSPRLTKAMARTMITASNKRACKAGHRLVDHGGLVGNAIDVDADRQLGLDLLIFFSSAAPNSSRLAPCFHADGEADRRLAIVAEQFCRRIDIAAMDGRDVGQREEAVVDAQIDRAQAFFRAELPADADGDALRPGLDEARGRDGVLRASVPVIAWMSRPSAAICRVENSR